MDRPHVRSCPCGWHGAYTSAGHADRHQRDHSCDTDWTPQPCPHPTLHQHGTYACYNHCGCRCWPCRRAAADAERTRRREHAYGRSRYTDATPAREHVQTLRAAGMGWPLIARLSGVSHDTLRRLIWGKKRSGGNKETSRRIERGVEQALLAVEPTLPDGGPGVDAGPTVRRLRALVALGWYPTLLARETGYHPAYMGRLLHGRALVRPGTARRVHRLYQQVATQPRPSSTYADRARRQARQRGWQPPIVIAGRVVAGQAIEQAEAA